MSLHLYKPLSSNDEAVRLEAAQTLTSELLTLLNSERTVQTKKDVDYALSRLTKGLASGSNSARPGFAVVLTEFLTNLQSSGNPEKWDISLEVILTAVKSNTTLQGHTTRPEERDYYLGRLFGLQSLLQSGITTKSKYTLSTYTEALSLLFELSRKKPWLRESCAWTICSSAQSWPAEAVGKAAELTYTAMVESGLARSSEGVAVWLTLSAYHPTVAPPKDVWANNSPLSSPNLASLGKILKEAGDQDVNSASKGSWNPKLHFVWDFILAIYFSEEGVWDDLKNRSRIAGWAELWRVVVDESLFSASSSEERKFHGFLLFIKSLELITTPVPSNISALFTKNFMRSFINQLSDPSRYLNKVASKCSRTLLTKAEAAPWTVPVIVTQLITNNGTPNFDQLTKGKNLDKILCLADEDGLVEVMRVLKNIILTPTPTAATTPEDIKAAEVRRQWACDQILSVVRNGKSVRSDRWLKEVVEMVTTFGHFDIVDRKKRPASAITAASQSMFRSRLLSCLSHLITINEGAKGAEGDETWPYKAVKTISMLQKDKGYKLAIEVDDTIAETLKRATKALEKIRKKRSILHKDPTKYSQLSSFELLYSLVILQVYTGEADALDVLDELQLCYDKVVRHSKRDAEDEGIDASKVLVEILLSFLSKPSVLLRKLAQQVFTSFVEKITICGLEATFGVLETKESLGGQQELFDRDEGEEEDVDIEDGDEELDSDVEVADAEEMDLDEDEGDGDDNEDDSSESDEDDIDETEASKLEAALSEALSSNNAAANDSDDSDMDDDAMLALDQHLAEIFKQRKDATKKSKKQESKHAKETITNFKNRVLDLLDIFAKSPRARRDITVSSKMLLPLLKCARTTRSKQVADRAASVIRTFANSLRGKEADISLPRGEDKEGLWELLEEIHVEAAKYGGVGRDKHKSACSQASLLVMKVLVTSGGMNGGDVERAVGVYAKSLTKLLTERSWRVQSGLFMDFVNWAASAGKKLQNEGK